MESKKCLIIDDEIESLEAKQGFLRLIKLPEEYAIFAQNYEEAQNIIRSRSDLAFCFLDCCIPQNEQPRNYPNNTEKSNSIDYGILLLSEIKYIPTLIYSAYVEESYLRKEASHYTNVVGAVTKPFNDLINLEIRKTFFEKIYDFSPTTEEVEALSFDYSFLQQEELFFVRERAQKIKKLQKRATKDILDIGTLLIEVKDKLKHGQFEKWIEIEFKWSGATAKRFMAVAREFKSVSLNDLENIVNTALYVLAAPITPKEAVEEAISLARQGETISEKRAKEIRNNYLERSPKKDNSPRTKAKKEEYSVTSLESSVLRLEKEERPRVADRRKGMLSDEEPADDHLPRSTIAFQEEKIPDRKQTNDIIEVKAKEVVETNNPTPVSQNRVKSLSTFEQPKQQILSVRHNLKNNFWQLGNNRLFCGNPSNNLFLENLPPKIALHFKFPPNNDKNLVPEITAHSNMELTSEYTDIHPSAIKTIVKTTIYEFTEPKEIVLFSYIFSVSVLKLAMDMDCYCWVAEPNLDVCQQILNFWRSQGKVERL